MENTITHNAEVTGPGRPAFSLTDILDCFAGAMIKAIDANYGNGGKPKTEEDGSWE